MSVEIVHCSILKLNMRSAQYLRLSGIIANRTNLCVVVFSVSTDCTTLIPHRLLKFSGVVFECCSDDKKSRGCLMSFRLYGGSGMVSM